MATRSVPFSTFKLPIDIEAASSAKGVNLVMSTPIHSIPARACSQPQAVLEPCRPVWAIGNAIAVAFMLAGRAGERINPDHVGQRCDGYDAAARAGGVRAHVG